MAKREDILELLIDDSFISELFGDYGESMLPDGDPWNTLLALLIGGIYSNVIKTGSAESYTAKTLIGRAKHFFERSHKEDVDIIRMIHEIANKEKLDIPKIVKDYFYGDLWFGNYIPSDPISIQDIKELADFLITYLPLLDRL